MDATSLKARQTAILAELTAMGPTTAGGMPTYTKDGQSFDHVGYRMSLCNELAEIQKLIVMIDGAFEVTSEVQ